MLSVLLAVALSAAPSEQIVLYIPRTSEQRAYTGSVPDEEFVPLFVADERIAAIGEYVDGAIVRRTPQGADVVVEMTYEPKPPDGLDPPEVLLADTKGRPHKPLRNPLSGKASLLIFKDVPAGEVTVSLNGKRWKTVQKKVEVTAPLTVAQEPLVAVVTSKVIVHWWTSANLESLLQRPVECAKAARTSVEREPEPFNIKLLHCTSEAPDHNERFVGLRDCTTRGQAALDPVDRKGEVAIEDAPAGPHYLRIAAPGLPALWKKVEVVGTDTTEVDFDVRWFSFFGRVRKGTDAVHATLFDTVTNPKTGEYVVFLASAPWRTGAVRPCDGSWPYHFVLDEPPRDNSRVDIDLPDNRLEVETTDAATGDAIVQASVTLTALEDEYEDRAHFGGVGLRTDAEGRVEFAPVLTKERLIVCADATGYARKCGEPILMGSAKTRTLQLALQKRDDRSGRVAVAGAIGRGLLLFYSPAGAKTEAVPVAADGTFTMREPHPEGQLVAFASSTHPFFVVTMPRIPDGESFVLRPPAGRVRTFTVTRAPATSEEVAFVTIAMGDLMVPLDALAQYGQRRQFNSAMNFASAIEIPDVLESAPLSVALIPASFFQQRSQGLDVAMLPESRSFPRQAVGASNRVVFD